MDYKSITYEKTDGIATITKVNKDMGYGMTRGVLVEMLRALADAEEDDAVRVIVITSAEGIHQGAIAVSEVIADSTPMQVREVVQIGHELGRRIETIEKPVIGVVKKEATGGGFETLQPCDFIIAAENATFCQPEVGFGTTAGWGGIQRISRMVPWRQAQRILMAGDVISGKESVELGITTQAVPLEEVDDVVEKLCNKLKSFPAQSLAYTKTDMHKAWEMNLTEALAFEVEALSVLLAEGLHRDSLPDLMEGKTPTFPLYKRKRSGKDWH